MQASISIIMATFNRAHFIVETLNSIQNQTFKNFECLIIDDGSTDNTIDVITTFLENDKRFKYYKRTANYNKGLPGSRNYGLDLAKGDYIIFFDDDDYIHSKNLETNIKVLEDNEFDFCSYHKKPFEKDVPLEVVEETKIENFISVNNLFETITHKISIASCTVMWRKKCFESIRFEESLLYAEEWECYTRIISNQNKGVQINNVLYFNRKHAQSNTGEFYSNNSLRRKSKSDAALLIVKNLNSKKLLSYAIIRYFILISYNFKEYNLFQSLVKELKLSLFQKMYWNAFYTVLPLRKRVTRLKKRIS
ncbi:glycosyltransferase family 2 protein [Flavobacterium sp.]